MTEAVWTIKTWLRREGLTLYAVTCAKEGYVIDSFETRADAETHILKMAKLKKFEADTWEYDENGVLIQ